MEYYQKESGVPLAELLEDIADDEDSPMNVVKNNKEDLSTTGLLENSGERSLYRSLGIDIKVEEEETRGRRYLTSITTHLSHQIS